MPTARTLITRALRLINVPGRGASLSADDTTDAFEALAELLDSQAVSKAVVPGINRHFFAVPAGQSKLTYGPGGDLDTDPFGDPAPVHIEDAYVRAGVAITDNEEVGDYDFTSAAAWTVGANWLIGNGVATASGAGTLSQALGLAAGTTYTVVVKATIEAGDVVLRINSDGSPLLEVTLDSSGTYEYEIGFTGATSDIELETDGAGDDLEIASVSIIERGLERLSLPVGGSDYQVRIVDQATYNRIFSKGVSGRPTRLLYSRRRPLAELALDSTVPAGELLVLDVLVNRIGVAGLDDELALNDDAIRWLRYKLADDMAPEYGKALTRDQRRTLDEAYDLMAAGNRRRNKLRVDRGLQARRGRYDINRGDP